MISVFAILTLFAQPQNPQNQRPLPNQFRDFVDHQQRWNMERPKIEKKDGKVIITMSEEQFRRMRMMRQKPRMMMGGSPQPICLRCNNHRRPIGHHF